MRSPCCFTYLAFFWALMAGAAHHAVAQAPRDAFSLGPHRTRGQVAAADIVNPKPVRALDGEDAMYEFLPPLPSGTRGNYRQFLQNKNKRRGQEFVALDGPWIEADIYDSRIATGATVTGWRNLVIGSSAAGARKLFAIHVPLNSESNAKAVYTPTAADILWEIDSSDNHFADLGAVLQKPSVGIMRDGTWVVILGNGFVDKKGSARLFIINALTGSFIKSIRLPTSANNGLGGVRLVLDMQRQITAAYAGDLQGNLWKFDFSSVHQADWKLAFGNTPLYKAKNASNQVEPITFSPAYVAHPQGGNLVIFGTSRVFESAQAGPDEIQSLYGVWDKVITGQSSGAITGAISTQSSGSAASGATSKLIQQTLSALGAMPYYRASTNAVNYADKRGWFIRLDNNSSGLHLAFSPQLEGGRVIFPVRSPIADAASVFAQRQGQSVRFVLNPFTGSGLSTTPTLEVNAGALDNAIGQTAVAGEKNTLRRSWRQILNRPAPGTITNARAS